MYTTRRFFRAIFIPQKIVQATLNDKSISQKFEKTRVYPFESRVRDLPEADGRWHGLLLTGIKMVVSNGQQCGAILCAAHASVDECRLSSVFQVI